MRRIAIALVGLALACSPPETTSPTATDTNTATLQVAADVSERLAQYSPTEMTADLSSLEPVDREVLAHLVLAGRLMDEVFLRQAWTGNSALSERVAAYTGEDVKALQDYYALNFGPWDRLEENKPFIGKAPHPAGAGYYPEDLTKEAFEAYVAEHPEAEAALESLTTVVRREGDELVAHPYSEVYGEWLKPAAEHLREAAALTENASLRRFLEERAAAFLSDDYYESDRAWMDLNSPVEVTIGPYETYEDALFGYKAAFTIFLTVDQPTESAKLADYKAQLPWLEGNLPIPDEHKNMGRGSESPIRVVDIVFTGGDTKAGIQTVAFNLPNDERVREEKGSKKVMLRNILRAKYDQILVPIAGLVLDPSQSGLSFEAFFAEVLHHELSHGLGPGTIEVEGRKTEVRLELKDIYSVTEEAKADVMGVYNILALIDKGVMPAELADSLGPTYLAGLFRSARFGVHEAHGQGVITQFNYLTERGALEVTDEGRYRIVEEKFPNAIRDLLHDYLMLHAKGDYAGTQAFLERYGHPTEELLAAIDRLNEQVPVDIRPIYSQAESLVAELEAP
jgi:hypothetical protein